MDKWQHIYSVNQFTREDIKELCELAAQMRDAVKSEGRLDTLKSKVVALLFFEASTRTSCSFNAALLRLGAGVISVDVMSSSTKKGESVQDTLRTLACYCDAIIMRHPEKGIFQKTLPYLDGFNVSLISGGDGDGEHPTQALLDIFTIQTELGRLDNLTVTMCGDLKYGRTVHSLSQLLSLYQGITINYVSPDELKMPQELIEKINLGPNNVEQNFSDRLTEDILSKTDVLYVTRLQKERFASYDHTDTEMITKIHDIVNSHIITADTLKPLKSTGIVMHPLPRVLELHESVDSHRSCVYFKQMHYGMFMRMALLQKVLVK
ncbi:aspartate carbamoyltransferase catalytic subunit [Acrasis kona]|uniref:aspartate carbamoyltransferase n=1 Tax=Acrasis kona TaxID=1008807 RepID=A0AAW2YQY6_9EUKA